MTNLIFAGFTLLDFAFLTTLVVELKFTERSTQNALKAALGATFGRTMGAGKLLCTLLAVLLLGIGLHQNGIPN